MNVLGAGTLEARAAESVRFERARREASTSCEGLFDGHRFERMAGKTDADCRGARKDGPPSISH
jgi:hypothetical protein